MYTIKQLSVFVENRSGELSDFTNVLSKNNISIKSIMLADSIDFGLVRCLVDNPDKAKAVLEDEGFSVKFTDVFGVKIDDVVGSFNRVVKALGEAKINIQYTYSFYESNCGIFIFCVEKDRFKEAIETMQKENIEVISASHFYK